MTRTIPHAPYIDAIEAALTEAKLTPEQADAFAEDSGDFAFLRGVVTLTPETSGIHVVRFPHGLIVVWEWHTGLDGDFDRGPVWQWARLNDDGSNRELKPLTAVGYASPEYVIESVRAMFEHRNQSVPAARWESTDELDAACEAWGTES
ncbi:hypothetical protein ACWEP4_40585 [Streptomyces sp. NPDC004227]